MKNKEHHTKLILIALKSSHCFGMVRVFRSQTQKLEQPCSEASALARQRSSIAKEIALFTVNFSHLHYNVFERGCEAISG